MTCGFISVRVFGSTDSDSLCGYYWFRDYAALEICGLSFLWFAYSILFSACNSGADPAPARSAFINRSLCWCCGMGVFTVEAFVFLLSCLFAFVAPELAMMFFLFMLIGTGWDYKGVNAQDAVKVVETQSSDTSPPMVNGQPAGVAARFDSIRPRIQFTGIKYKQVPTNIV